MSINFSLQRYLPKECDTPAEQVAHTCAFSRTLNFQTNLNGRLKFGKYVVLEVLGPSGAWLQTGGPLDFLTSSFAPFDRSGRKTQFRKKFPKKISKKNFQQDSTKILKNLQTNFWNKFHKNNSEKFLKTHF